MTPAQQLAALPPATIRLDKAVVLDWYDGPREGFMSLVGVSSTWYFDVIAEMPRADPPDDRIYALWSAPADAIDRLSQTFPDDLATSPLWIPSWHSSDQNIQHRVGAELADIMANVDRAEVMLRSGDLQSIEDVWLVTRPLPYRPLTTEG